MQRTVWFTSALGALLLTSLVGGGCGSHQHVTGRAAAFQPPSAPPRPPARLSRAATPQVQLQTAYGQLPLSFELNAGQTAEQVEFLARGLGYTLFLSAAEATLVLPKPGKRAPPASPEEQIRGRRPELAPVEYSVLRMQLVGANPNPSAEGRDQLPGIVNYFVGNEPEKWRTDIPTYAKVSYHEVYPGVDLVYYGNQRNLEYDFIIAPGTDPGQIQLAFAGATQLKKGAAGELIVQTEESEIQLQKPLVYQEVNGSKQSIPCEYVLLSGSGVGRPDQVGFKVEEYDASRPLIIDPVLVYSTYLGGSDDDNGRDIAVDGTGNAYITGRTFSVDFPTVNPVQATFGGRDAFVTKLSASGTTLLYSTYLGGSDLDWGLGIAVDGTGNAYITGFTTAADFPTVNPVQATFGGGRDDTFVTKLSASGTTLLYSTYLGGSASDQGLGVAVDSPGNAYITGFTEAADFPTENPVQATFGGGSRDTFVTKLSASGTTLLYSTYLGGSDLDEGVGIAVGGAGDAYITGQTGSADFPTENPVQATFGGGSRDTFVTKLSASGTTLLYSTYLGGSGRDQGFDIAVDSPGNAYITGFTEAADFPTENPVQATFGGGSRDTFVTKLSASGTTLLYSTYLGGSGLDRGFGITVDSAGNAYITGQTESADFPTENPVQETLGGSFDAFVTQLSANGRTLVYSTFLGGNRSEMPSLGVAVDSASNAYITGMSFSADFPTVNSLQGTFRGGQTDVFVAKITAETTLAASPLVLNFGEVSIGSAQELSLTLQNTGEDPLTGTVGTPPSPFSVVAGGGSFNLAADASVTVTLRFAPTTTESFGGVANISSGGGSTSIFLSGVGTASSVSALSVCSPNLSFSQAALGQSIDLACIITNTGTGTLEGNAITASPFSLVSGDSFTLMAEQSQSVVVRFTPGSVGAIEEGLRVTSNGGSTTIVLQGTGVQDPVLAVNPTRLNFGSVRVGQSRDLSLTVRNIGGDMLNRTVCVPSGFRVVSADSFNLAAGQGQTVTIRFNPLRASAFNATVTFTADLCDDPNPQTDSTTAVINGVGVEEIATGQAYVANRGSNTVSVINTTTQTVEATILVGNQPVALALTPDTRTLYVVNFRSNDVSVVDTVNRQQVQRIAVGLSPREIVIRADGRRAYVANQDEDSVSILDLANNQLLSTEKIRRPFPSVLALSPDGKVLYVLGTGSDLVGLLETATNQKARLTTGADPVAIAFSPDGDSAYIVNQGDNTVSVLDARTFPPSIVCDVAVEDAPVSVAVTPDGEKVYVANALDDSLSVFNPCTPNKGASQSAGQARPKETLASKRIVIPDWSESTNLQFDPNYPIQMLVVNSSSNNVGILDITTDQAQATIPVGTTPEQNAFDTELPQAVVTNLGSDDVALVNTENSSTTFVPVGDAPVDVVFNIQASASGPPVPQGFLENPQPDSFQSGIGVISGFVCDANQILIEFNGTATFEAAYGTSRGDTESVCGDSNNGFSLLFNWNLLGNGTHTVRALAGGVEFANVTITVTTLGSEFRTDLSRTVTVPDFPMPGQTTNLRWQQGQQNFVIFSGAGGGGGSSGDAQRVLENPPPGSFQSGVGVISGFVCNATQILIEFDGVASFEAAYGTSRGDTQTVCGDANNAFSLLFNWNLLGNGMHTVRAFADGVMFAEVAITVTTLGSEFRTGLSGTVTVPDFPQAGQTTSLRWQQSQQNFVIDGVF